MVAWSVSQMFFEDGFWMAIVAGLLVVLFLLSKKYPQPSPKSCDFLIKHRKAIARAADVLVIGAVLLWSMLFLDLLREESAAAWHAPPEHQGYRDVMISSSFAVLVVWSGPVGALLGLLSCFRSNLTRFKRTVLLGLCLLPVLFATLALLTGPAEWGWLLIQLCLLFSAPDWVANGSRVVTGQPLSHIVGRIMCKLHLASGDVPD